MYYREPVAGMGFWGLNAFFSSGFGKMLTGIGLEVGKVAATVAIAGSIAPKQPKTGSTAQQQQQQAAIVQQQQQLAAAQQQQQADVLKWVLPGAIVLAAVILKK